MSYLVIRFAGAINDDEDEFEKWQREVKEAEAEAERLKNGFLSGSAAGQFGMDDHDRIQSPPDGEEEFTDDDGTTYKWDRSLRAWVPQVGLNVSIFSGFLFCFSVFIMTILVIFLSILELRFTSFCCLRDCVFFF